MQTRTIEKGLMTSYLKLKIFIILLIANPIGAELNIGSDLANRHIWRGSQRSQSFVIQPKAVYINGPWELGFASSWPLTGRGEENDLFLNLILGPLKFVLTDNYSPHESDFFNFGKNDDIHHLEIGGLYVYQNIQVFSGFNFWGDSADSFYLETKLGLFEQEEAKVSLILGAGNGIYIINTKDFDLVNVTISAEKNGFTAHYILNPDIEKTWFVLKKSF